VHLNGNAVKRLRLPQSILTVSAGINKICYVFAINFFPLFEGSIYISVVSNQAFFSRFTPIVTKTKNVRNKTYLSLLLAVRSPGKEVLSTDSEIWQQSGTTSETVGGIAGRGKDSYLTKI